MPPAAGTLFATHGGAGTVDTHLYIVDAVTTAVTDVGDTGHVFTGLAFDPTDGTLYGVTGNTGPDTRTLFQVDPETGAATLVGSVGDTVADICFDDAGQMYGWKPNGAIARNRLALIDKATGARTDLAPSGITTNGCGITFVAGVLYLSPNGPSGDLYTVDPATGAVTDIGTMDGPGGTYTDSMTTRFGVLWGMGGRIGAVFTVGAVSGGVAPVTVVGTLDVTVSGWDSLVAVPGADPGPGPPPDIDVSFAGVRFFEGYEWRYLFTDLSCVATTWAHGLLKDRRIALALNQESTIEGSVIDPSDFRVNGIWTDGYPRIAQSNRLVFAFRREGGTPRWRVRAAGILMSPEDEGDVDSAVSHFTAYDPWKYLEGRPCMDAGGALPGPDGFFLPYAGNVVALTLLKNTIVNEGGCFVDAGVAYGGTAFYGGTIETTDPINFNVQQGMMVAEAWQQLTDAGNCDIVLDPIYDPVNRPGYTHEISIYKLAGKRKPNALFAWDRLNRSVAKISRLHDGTPGAFFDKVQYHAGSGGPPIPATGPLVNAAAVAAFGSVWSSQFFPAQTDTDPLGSAVLAMAKQALVMAKQGRRTMTLYPITERAPVPLRAYGLGDRVPIYASKGLRVETNGYQRVQAIPIEIDDDGRELVGGLLCTPDWRAATGSSA